jgi:Ca-activated chloride channel family protein
MLRFASPWFLVLLALLPAAWWVKRRRAGRPALRVSRLGGGGEVPVSWAVRLAPWVEALRWAALVLLIVALARPQWGRREMSVLTEGVDIVLDVDVSGSMRALDFRLDGRPASRLEAVKSVVSDFIDGLQGDRVGLVVFGSEAYTQVPPTRDYPLIERVLKRVEVGSAGKKTALGDALGISLKRLEEAPGESRVVILLTDGQSNAGEISPRTAAQLAKELGVKVYTIGVGTRGTAPVPVNDPVFGRRYVQQRVNIDEAALQEIADATGGLYFRATDTEGLQTIYERIKEMETTRAEVKTYDDFEDLYAHLVWPGVALLAGWAVLRSTRFRRTP